MQPRHLIATLFDMQHKVEDGALSMGLGDKAGKGLPLFNASLASGETTNRIVLVKRQVAARAEAPKVKSRGGGSADAQPASLANLTAKALARRNGKAKGVGLGGTRGESEADAEFPLAPSLRKQRSDEGKGLLAGAI